MAANFFAVSLLDHDGTKVKRGYEGFSQTTTNRPLGFYLDLPIFNFSSLFPLIFFSAGVRVV